MNQSANSNVRHHVRHLFVFLEIFAREGGIQSYVKDIFQAYRSLAERGGEEGKPLPWQAEVLLLRDRATAPNPFAPANCFQFRYLYTPSPWLGRLRLAAALLMVLLVNRPQRVFCGHINLVPLVRLLCQPLGIPYTVLTYGKEVWQPLAPVYQAGLKQAASIWTISRYSRDRASVSNQLDSDCIQLLPCVVHGDQFTPGPKPESLIQRYHLQGARVLMTVARLWSGDIYKGVDVTLRALPQIAQVVPSSGAVTTSLDWPNSHKILASSIASSLQASFPTKNWQTTIASPTPISCPRKKGSVSFTWRPWPVAFPSSPATPTAPPIRCKMVGWAGKCPTAIQMPSPPPAPNCWQATTSAATVNGCGKKPWPNLALKR